MDSVERVQSRPGRVLVIGSLNQDVTMRVPAFPAPGETLIASEVHRSLGGKGANQASAAAAMGAQTVMVGLVGDDDAGAASRSELAQRSVDVQRIGVSEQPTGMAMILVSAAGENIVTVASGANAALDHGTVSAQLADVQAHDVLVAQGEIPEQALRAVAEAARSSGCRFLLNLAPVTSYDPAIISSADPLVLNEHEARLLAGFQPDAVDPLEQARAFIQELTSRYGCPVVVTLGEQGALLGDGENVEHCPAPESTRVVDTTGAGDAFVGAVAAALALGMQLMQAIGWGVRVGTLSVTQQGARLVLSPDDALVKRLREGHGSYAK